MIFADSNVLIDILEQDEVWFDWSSASLARASATDTIAVTPIIIAEVGPTFPSLEIFYEHMRALLIAVEPLTDQAALAAGFAFREYRRLREGPKSILADFLIGGQALIAGAAILTRDPAIYARYFPSVPLISPDRA